MALLLLSGCLGDFSLSDPGKVFLGNGSWTGDTVKLPIDKTIVLNIPVSSGQTITLSTANPSLGFYSCNTIYNFYPVDNDGSYNPNATFTIDRVTLGFVEGLVLAPHAHVREGPSGGFGGQVFIGEYSWIDRDNGANVRDYIATSDTCPRFQGCLPLEPGREAPADMDLPELDDGADVIITESDDDIEELTSSISESDARTSGTVTSSEISSSLVSSWLPGSTESLSTSDTAVTSTSSQPALHTITSTAVITKYIAVSNSTSVFTTTVNIDTPGSIFPSQQHLSTYEHTITMISDITTQITETTTETTTQDHTTTYTTAPTVTFTVTDMEASIITNTESEEFTRTIHSVDYLNRIHTLTELVATTRTHIDTEIHTDFHSDLVTIVLPVVITARSTETVTQPMTTTTTIYVPVFNEY
ncbi:hypothetical protein BJV82DRAFT_251015 [Fennellomyces sp. T-0311]|nr:hypothetical protein BJV82DRAFT_251015 [Fennellomyces sp. T-0311]